MLDFKYKQKSFISLKLLVIFFLNKQKFFKKKKYVQHLNLFILI